MKRFFELAIAVKERTALIYTGAMCFYLFFLWVFKQEAAPISTVFSLLLVSIAAGAMQIAAFSDLLFKKLAYGWRLAVFAVPFFAVLTAVAVGFGWFPTDKMGAWIWFVISFIVIFLFITAGIELYYRLRGKKYDDRLDWYRRRKGE